jgi:hypothetical protein
MAKGRICRGCGKQMQGIASREHILPQWVHPHIELAGVSLEHRAVSEGGVSLLRSHDLGNFTVKVICDKCNNGWMSVLESEAKPALLPLVKGKRSAASLTFVEATLVSRWAFKTAFMLLPGQKTNPVPWNLFERWAISGAGAPDPAIIFALSNLQNNRGFGYVTESDELAGTPVRPANIRVSICIGALFLIVLLPLGDGRRVPGSGHPLLRLLWPLNVTPIRIPTQVISTAGMAYGEFIKHLGGFANAGVPPLE